MANYLRFEPLGKNVWRVRENNVAIGGVTKQRGAFEFTRYARREFHDLDSYVNVRAFVERENEGVDRVG